MFAISIIASTAEAQSEAPLIASLCDESSESDKILLLRKEISEVKKSFSLATEQISEVGGALDGKRCDTLKDLTSLVGSYDRLKLKYTDGELDEAFCKTPGEKERLSRVSQALQEQVSLAITENFGATEFLKQANVALEQCDVESASKALGEIIKRPGICDEETLRQAIRLRQRASSAQGIPAGMQQEISVMVQGAEEHYERCEVKAGLEIVSQLKQVVDPEKPCGGNSLDQQKIIALEQKLLALEQELNTAKATIFPEIEKLVANVNELKQTEALAVQEPGKYERTMKRQLFNTRLPLSKIRSQLEQMKPAICYEKSLTFVDAQLQTLDRIKVPGR